MEKIGCTPDELVARVDAFGNGSRQLAEIEAYFRILREEDELREERRKREAEEGKRGEAPGGPTFA